MRRSSGLLSFRSVSRGFLNSLFLSTAVLLVACGGGDDPPAVVVNQSVGGSVSGLAGTLVLQNNGADPITRSSDGNFTFPTQLAGGSAYAVTVRTQPAGQICSVSNGTGAIGSGPVTNVTVVCASSFHSVGGTVSGLSGTVTLRNNGGNDLTLNANAPFTFTTQVAQGSAYAVTVQTQPATQTCSVSNGTGTMGTTNITNVIVTCSTNARTVGGTVSGLSGTVTLQNNVADNLPLSSNGSFTFATPVAQGATYNVTVLSQPSAQTCTVTNGSGTAAGSNITNVGVVCTNNTTTLSVTANVAVAVGSSANATVTNTGVYTATNVSATLPGGWAAVTQVASACASLAPSASCNLTFSSTAPYVAQTFSVSGDNTNTVNSAMAFTLGGYQVFAVDSATSARVVDTARNTGGQWSPDQTSTGCNSLANGRSNTNCILAAYPGNNAIAAAICNNSTRGSVPVGTWYLPAVCEMAGTESPSICPAGLPNIQTNLRDLGFTVDETAYFTSTETDPFSAYLENYQPGIPPNQFGYTKNSTPARTLCVKSVSY